MRGINFQRLAPSGGLQFGAAAANGLNQAASNYAKMKLQSAHMKALQAQAQGMQAWRQAQADSLRQRSMSADMAKLDMLTSASKSGQYNPATIKKFESQYMANVLENMSPQEAMAAKQRFDSMADKGQVADEFRPNMGLNPNEAKIYGQQLSANAGIQRAQIGGDSRQAAAQTYADSRTEVANSQKEAKLGAAGIYAGSRSPNDPNKIAYTKDLDLRNHLTNQLYSQNMGIPLTDDAKNGIRGELEQVNQRISNYHAQGQGAQGQSSQGQGAAQSAPAAPAAQQGGGQASGGSQQPFYPTPTGAPPAQSGGRILQHDQWQQAQPGDTVIHEDGKAYKALGQGQFAPMATPTPQSAGTIPVSLPPVPSGAAAQNQIGGGE